MGAHPAEAALLRLCPHEALDLDPILAPLDPRSGGRGRDIAPCGADDVLPPLRPAREDMVAVGVRVNAPLADPSDLALRLAALAMERDAEIVVLGGLDYSGLEAFGFRTARIAGATTEEREACEAQIRAFWGIEVII